MLINSSGNMILVTETNTGQVLQFNLAPPNFGNVNVCQAGQSAPAPCSQTMTWNYTINSGVTVGAVNAVTQGAQNLDFSLASNTCTGSFSAVSSCAVSVTFTPQAVGLRRGAVQLLDENGNVLATTYISGNGIAPEVTFGNATGTNLTTGLPKLGGVAIDASGNVYVAEGDQVAKISSAGAITTVTGLPGANGVAVDGAGDLFVVEQDSTSVTEVPASGGSQITVGSGLSAPSGVAVDGSGDIFVADTLNARVLEILPNGAQMTVGSGWLAPTAVAVDAAGDLWVADVRLGEVIEIAAGGAQSVVASGLQPNGVAVDAAGDVFITQADSTLLEVFPNGSQSSIITGVTTTAGVAVDSLGNLYVADTRDHLVKVPVSQPPTLTFSAEPYDSTGLPQSVILENIGNASLTLTGLTAGTNFEQVSGPGSPADCAASSAVAPGAQCNISISFSPSTVGTIQSSFMLADNVLNGSPATQYITLNGTGQQASQQISFPAPPATVTYGSGPYTLNATASSGLPVSYNLVGSAATLSGSTLTITGTGVVNIYASQAGNADYAAALTIVQAMTINPASQTITFGGLPATATYGSAGPYTLNATASSGLPVSYSVTGPASISGSTLTITGAGTVLVTAAQAGNGNYTAATSVSQTITVSAASQTITFTGLPASATYGSAGPYTLNATASSGLPVSYSVTGPATVSGSTLTITGAGTVVVTASQAGNSSYAAATSVSQTITVTPASQTITFTGLPATAAYGSAGPYTLSAFASSGLAVSYSATGPASISGSTLTITGAGSVVVTASQTGNSNYAAATPVSQTITVSAASQTITFTGLPATATYGSAGPYTLSAPATSGLPVSFSVSGPASISGSTLTITGVGSVVVTASQAGNTNYAAATPASQTITVSAESQTIAFTGLPATATYGSAGPYTLSATASSGLPVSYSVTGPASISGSTLTITGAGTVTVTASQAGNTNYKAATPVSQSIVVSAESQTITFSAIPAQTVGAKVALTASASSSLPVSFASSTPAVCRVSGPTATMVAAGSPGLPTWQCPVRRRHSGNAKLYGERGDQLHHHADSRLRDRQPGR